MRPAELATVSNTTCEVSTVAFMTVSRVGGHERVSALNEKELSSEARKRSGLARQKLPTRGKGFAVGGSWVPVACTRISQTRVCPPECDPAADEPSSHGVEGAIAAPGARAA
eukprot:5134822-Prymnesium_polylepis.1